MKTLTKRKSLMGFIYALIMLLPFSSILVRCLYVTFNKNAYVSQVSAYLDKYTEVTSSDQLVENNQYLITYNGNNQAYYNPTKYFYNTINVNWYEYPNTDTSHTYIGFAIRGYGYNGTTQGNNIRLYYDETNYDNTYIWGTQLNQIIFTLKSYSNFNLNTEPDHPYKLYNLDILYTTDYDMLNNTFDYSLYTFLNENGTGRLNLTDWFTDIFLNRTTHNMLYLNYVNWYMNYSLLVSCVYLLYSVLMWFLTFARTLLNKPLKECD